MDCKKMILIMCGGMLLHDFLVGILNYSVKKIKDDKCSNGRPPSEISSGHRKNEGAKMRKIGFGENEV